MSLGVPTSRNVAAASLGVVLSESFRNVSQKLVLSASVGPASLADDEESDEPQPAAPPRTTSRAAAPATFVVNIWRSPHRWCRPTLPPVTRSRHIPAHRESGSSRRPRRQPLAEEARQQAQVVLPPQLTHAQRREVWRLPLRVDQPVRAVVEERHQGD